MPDSVHASSTAALGFLIGISSFPPGQPEDSCWSPSWPRPLLPSLPSRCAGHPAVPSTQALTPGCGTGHFSLSRFHGRARLLPPLLGSNLLPQGGFSQRPLKLHLCLAQRAARVEDHCPSPRGGKCLGSSDTGIKTFCSDPCSMLFLTQYTATPLSHALPPTDP